MSTREWAEKLPSKVRVAAYDYVIELMPSFQAAKRLAFGEFSVNDQKISIQIDTPTLSKLIDTVLHEICHGIFYAYGIEDEDKEERIVSAIGTAWAQIWRDNPLLLDWLNAATAEVRVL